MEIIAGSVYAAPGDFQLRIESRNDEAVLVTDAGHKVDSCRPAVDPLFFSVARLYRKHTLGIVLTGMGKAGLEVGAFVMPRAKHGEGWGNQCALGQAGGCRER